MSDNERREKKKGREKNYENEGKNKEEKTRKGNEERLEDNNKSDINLSEPRVRVEKRDLDREKPNGVLQRREGKARRKEGRVSLPRQ